MKFLSPISIVLTGVVLSGCASQPTVTVDFAAQGSTCTKVQYLSICEADLRASFPQLKLGDKFLGLLNYDTNDNDNDSRMVITYSPDVTGPHSALSKDFDCIEHKRGREYWCHLDQTPAYFDTDAEYYLKTTGDVSPEDAIAIVHLVMAGKTVAKDPDWVRGLPLADHLGNVRYYTLSKRLGGFTLILSTDGCWGSVHVALEGMGDSQVLRISDAPNEMCI